eukprot:comp23849_c0_seq1/m.41670 comp23849_c0_seq1/g.41670  ORF comp23849_c0_seq1/g.41670 comp23849_c0_seq1/m.41670 type:complete len:342 (-) comp23849_c0_seq1:174-1199(-)
MTDTKAHKPAKATVLGGGAFGTAMAQLLGRQNVNVDVWVMEEEVRDAINNKHENTVFLPDIPLSPTVHAVATVEEAFAGTELVLVVVPTPFLRSFVIKYRAVFPVGVPIICCSKGIEKDTLDTPWEIVRDELPGKYTRYLGCMSGPSFAKEVALGMPTNVTVASHDPEIATKVQLQLSDTVFRAYTSSDIIGCELAGAIKNVLAIACGASDGFGFGYDARAALITRGLAELGRLITAKGGDIRTLTSLAGVGDLVLTCTGPLSRNFTVGQRLAKGETIADIKQGMKAVAEGVYAAEGAHQLAEKLGVDMPITEQVYRVLYHGLSISDALKNLQGRSLKSEF